MRDAPDPYRVLAHALEVGDERLAALLRARLRHRRPQARRTVERLLRALGLN